MDGKPTPDKEQSKSITEEQLHKKLDTYEQLADKPEDKFSIMRFRNNYMELKQKADAINGIQREHFQQGVQKGIHQDKDIDKQLQAEQYREQTLRKGTLEKAKSHYQQNYSLTVTFTESSIPKGKNKPLDKGK
ncbi:MAG: hypothetical protein JNK00_00325 [Flavipsychrobacter sp.]|nr:hypothetical protein [Flavipsychrobacter sp.]